MTRNYARILIRDGKPVLRTIDTSGDDRTVVLKHGNLVLLIEEAAAALRYADKG